MLPPTPCPHSHIHSCVSLCGKRGTCQHFVVISVSGNADDDDDDDDASPRSFIDIAAYNGI